MANDKKSSAAPRILFGCGCLSVLIGLALLGAAAFYATRKPPLAHYINTREGRSGNLSENYVDFSFDYPKDWTIKTSDPDNINYVMLSKEVDKKTHENLSVGYLTIDNASLYPQLIGQVESAFQSQFQKFEKVTEGPAKVNGYDGYQGIWHGTTTGSDGKPVDVYVREILLPKPGSTKGVGLLMMGTSFAPYITSGNDVGTTGGLKYVLESFKYQ